MVYADIRNIHDIDVPAFIQELTRTIKFDDSVMTIFVPTRVSDSRVECINPVLLTKKKVSRILHSGCLL